MLQNDLVSVLMPLYNARPLLQRSLTSVLKQTHQNLEIVLVNNASTDGSDEAAAAILRGTKIPWKILHNPSPRQQNRTRRMAFENCSGQFIQWLDADDELGFMKIENQLSALTAHSEADFACGEIAIREFDHVHFKILHEHIFDQRPQLNLVLFFLFVAFPNPHRFLFRRSAAQLLHDGLGWHPDTPRQAAYHHLLLAACLNLKMIYVKNSPCFYNKWSESQLHKSINLNNRVENTANIHSRILSAVQNLGVLQNEFVQNALEISSGVYQPDSQFADPLDFAEAIVWRSIRKEGEPKQLAIWLRNIVEQLGDLRGRQAWLFEVMRRWIAEKRMIGGGAHS